jgi:hypothetical protein
MMIEKVIWGDVELDKKAETFVGILLNRMKNYIPSVQKSVYIRNSVQTKKRKKAQAKKLLIVTSISSNHPSSDPDKPDNQSNDQILMIKILNENILIMIYEQLIKSLKN